MKLKTFFDVASHTSTRLYLSPFFHHSDEIDGALQSLQSLNKILRRKHMSALAVMPWLKMQAEESFLFVIHLQAPPR